MARSQSIAGHPGARTRGVTGGTSVAQDSKEESAVCSECGGRLRPDGTETVCSNCGLVTDTDAIDYGPEWRGFDGTHNQVRCNGSGESILMHDKGLGSEVDTTVTTGRLHRQSMYQRRSKCEGGQRGLRYILTQIQRISSRLSLPDYATKDAAYYARRAHEQDIPGGRSLEWVTGGAIYAAIRERELPVRPGEVAEYLREDEATASGRDGILQAYSYICRELGLSITPMLPKDYLPRLFNSLDLSAEEELEVRRVLSEIEGETGGATPSAVAAGAIRQITQNRSGSPLLKEIGAIFGHNPRTIRNNAERIADVADGLSP